MCISYLYVAFFIKYPVTKITVLRGPLERNVIISSLLSGSVMPSVVWQTHKVSLKVICAMLCLSNARVAPGFSPRAGALGVHRENPILPQESRQSPRGIMTRRMSLCSHT